MSAHAFHPMSSSSLHWGKGDSCHVPPSARVSDLTGATWEEDNSETSYGLDGSASDHHCLDNSNGNHHARSCLMDQDKTDTSKSALDARLKEELNMCGLRGSMHLKSNKKKTGSIRFVTHNGECEMDYLLVLLLLVMVPSLVFLTSNKGDSFGIDMANIVLEWRDVRLGVAIVAFLAATWWFTQSSSETQPTNASPIYVLLQKAEQGDVEAMEWMGRNCNDGINGFRQDYTKALMWYQRAAKAGSVIGTAMVGDFLVKEVVLRGKHAKGFTYLALAAERGSDLAAFTLGKAFAEGLCGANEDREEAIHWIQKLTSGKCTVRHLDDEYKIEAQEILEELQRNKD